MARGEALQNGKAYVLRQRARGDSDALIARSLVERGWTEDDIDELWEAVWEEAGGPTADKMFWPKSSWQGHEQLTRDAFGECVERCEELPLPRVLYPATRASQGRSALGAGSFLAFQAGDDGRIVLCSCARKAVRNCITLAARYVSQHWGTQVLVPRDASFSTEPLTLLWGEFPAPLITSLLRQGAPADEGIGEWLVFQDGVCHKCNRVTPAYRYWEEPLVSTYMHTYGWYVKQQYYEFGVAPHGRVGYPPWWQDYIEEACRPDVLAVIKELDACHARTRRYEEMKQLGGPERNKDAGLKKLVTEIRQQVLRLDEIVEDAVREQFGHRSVEDAWIGETTLYGIISSLYPEAVVHRHYRPDFLEGLELDIYLEDVKAGIEYQGRQHFEPVERWGGQASFEYQQERDHHKKEICEREGIRLIYFRYDEELSPDLVRERLEGSS